LAGRSVAAPPTAADGSGRSPLRSPLLLPLLLLPLLLLPLLGAAVPTL